MSKQKNGRARSVDEILDEIARNRETLAETNRRAREQDAKLDAYREELARETARLRAKHDADAVERLTLELRREASRLAELARRDAMSVIPALALELMSAGETVDEMRSIVWLDERGVLLCAETSDEDTVTSQLRTLVSEIDENGVEYVDTTRADELAAYGYHELRSKNRTAHHVKGTILVSIHVDAIKRVRELRDEIRERANATRAIVEDRERERRRSLYEQLRREFEPDEQKGDDQE